jgi:hypothetical protein
LSTSVPPFQFSFHWLLQTHHHLSSRAGTIGQTVTEVPSGLSLTPPQETKKNRMLTDLKERGCGLFYSAADCTLDVRSCKNAVVPVVLLSEPYVILFHDWACAKAQFWGL